MADARSEVRIVISGSAVGLQEALKQAQAGLSAFGAQADKAGAQAGGALASGERKAAHEATVLGERARVAAEMVGLLGAESSEQVLKIEGLSSAFRSAQRAFGGFGGALAAAAGSFVLFKGLDFMRDSVDAAMEGEKAAAAFNAALGKTPALAAAARQSIEEHRTTLTRLGIDDSDVMAQMAAAAGKGLDPRLITENADAFADLGVALKTDFGGAIDAVTHGQRGLNQVMTRLNLSAQQQKALMLSLRGATPEERVRAILALVESSKFAGAAEAQAGTTQGKFTAFHTALHNLQEEVGTALLPALTQLAEAMTGLLGAAERISQPFGGLANVIKTLFVPMLGLGLLLFTNLRGVMTRLVDVLLGRLVGAFAQTAGSMAEADAEARNLAADIGDIPELAKTTAVFTPDPAKELWIANVLSVPKVAPTTAVFTPAAIPEGAMARIPVALAADDKALAQQAQQIRARAASDLAKGGPIPVKVRPQWVSDAASGLKTGLAIGTAAALTDVIFNSVTIKHVTFPAAAPAKGGTAVPAAPVAPSVTISGTPHVYVTNMGAIGPALVKGGGTPPQATATGPPATVPLAQTVRISGVPTVKLDRTTPIQGTMTMPSSIAVKAQQSGGWEVGLKPDTFARFGQLVGEIAIGVMIGNVLQGFMNKIPFGKLADALKGIFRGRGGKGGGNVPDNEKGPDFTQMAVFDIGTMLEDVVKQLPQSGVNLSASAGSTFMVSGMTNAFKSIDWSAVLSAAGVAAKIAGAIALALATALLAVLSGLGKVLGAFFGPTAAAAETTAEAKRLGLDKKKTAALQHSMAGALGDIASAILGGIGDAIKRGMIGLENLFLGFFNAIIDKVKSAPVVGGLFKGLADIPLIPVPPAPHQGAHSGRTGGGAGGGGHRGAAGLSIVDPALVATAAQIVQSAVPAGQVSHNTYHATFNIHGATDANVVARQVNRAFSEFVQGVRSSRRLHG